MTAARAQYGGYYSQQGAQGYAAPGPAAGYGQPAPFAAQPPYGQPQPGYTQQQPVYGRSPYNQSPGAPPPPPSGYGLPGYGAPAQGYGRAYEATATPYSQPPYGQHAAPYGPAGGAGGYAPAVTAPTPIQGPGYYQQQPQPSPPPPVPVAFAAGALPPPPGKYAASPTEQPPLPSAAATPPSSAAVAPRPTVSSSYTPLAATAGHPTVVSEPGAEAERDAEAVRDALRHGGSALHQTLTNLIGSRSTTQRQAIRRCYKTMLGRDLLKDIDDKVSGTYQRTILALMRDEPERDAHLLYKALSGWGVDADVLTEVLVSRNNEQLTAIKAQYREMYKVDLDKAIEKGCSGQFAKLMIGLAQANRTPWNTEVDTVKMRADARKLYSAGEGRWGTERSEFRRLMNVRSIPQLQCIFYEYRQLCGKTIEDSVKSELSGDLEKGVKAICRYVDNPHKFWARTLYKSMKGLGTDDRRLTRIVVGRCEHDMVEIKAVFQKIYRKSLESWVRSETSGSYRHLLLMLIGTGST